MKNDFSRYAIPLLIFNCICVDVALIVATVKDPLTVYVNATMGTIWGQFALVCAARLRYPQYRARANYWLVGIPLLSMGVYPLIEPNGYWWAMLILILIAFALTAIMCLVPATIFAWLYGREGRQIGIKHLLVFTGAFAVASSALSQLDFAGPLLAAFTLFALPSIVASILLSQPDRPVLYTVTIVLFLPLGWFMLALLDWRGFERSQEILYTQVISLWLGGQFLMAAGRSEPHELERAEVADDHHDE